MNLLADGKTAAPRYTSVPPAASSAGEEAVDFCRSIGLDLDIAQELVLDGGLGEQANGKWAAFEVAVVEPRQNGKSVVLGGRELSGLYLFDERLQTHTAHRFDTTLAHYWWLRELIEGTPDLSRRVKAMPDSNGKEAIVLMNGARLQFKARSKGGGRGMSGDLVVLDEAFYLKELGSLVPTMSARMDMTPAGPQLWYGSSAPLPTEESDPLRAVMRRGRELSMALAA